MIQNRVIPVLLMSDGKLYKTKKYSNPRYIGDPINVIRIFNEKEVDELIILDISASRLKVEPDYERIKELASECFMPLCYGGGISNLDQAKRVFSLGIEKISIQTQALSNLDLITEVANIFGSQSIVLSVDLKKNLFGTSKLYGSSQSKVINKNILQFISEAVNAGAGEILLSSVDNEGLMKGMNLELISQISSAIPVPLIANCGVGSLEHIKEAINSGASAVAAGSFFVYHGPHNAVLITYPSSADLKKILQ